MTADRVPKPVHSQATFVCRLSAHSRSLCQSSPAQVDNTRHTLPHSCTQVCYSSPCHTSCSFGVSQKLRKTTIRSVRLSVHMEELDSHRKDFDEISYLRIFFFSKSVEKIQVSLESDKNNRYCSCSRPTYIFDHISLSSS